jgi:hypothetical protein
VWDTEFASPHVEKDYWKNGKGFEVWNYIILYHFISIICYVNFYISFVSYFTLFQVSINDNNLTISNVTIKDDNVIIDLGNNLPTEGRVRVYIYIYMVMKCVYLTILYIHIVGWLRSNHNFSIKAWGHEKMGIIERFGFFHGIYFETTTS